MNVKSPIYFSDSRNYDEWKDKMEFSICFERQLGQELEQRVGYIILFYFI